MNKTLTKIIIDTNALLALIEYNIDFISELQRILDIPYKICILAATKDEFEKLKQTESLKIRRRIMLIESLIPKLKIEILPDQGYVDEILINYSLQHNLILTQDQALKQKLQRPYLTIRQQKKIIIVQ
jgi:rRNA-processing protein FCF1